MPRPKKDVNAAFALVAKVCVRCGVERPISEFYRSKRNKSGYYPYCKSCNSALNKKWRKSHKKLCGVYSKRNTDKRTKIWKEYKRGLKCIKCGESHSACLDFHHRNPDEKQFDIGGAFWEKSIERVINEITKCDVLCANCHRKLHYNLKNEGDRK